MKKLFVSLLSLVSLSLIACPQFSGSFTCTSNDSDGTVENYNMMVTQQGNVYTTIDNEGAEVLVADGVVRDIEEGLTMVARCVGNTIEMVIEGTTPARGEQPEVSIYSDIVIVPTSTSVTMEASTTVKVPAYGYEDVQSSSTKCQKI